MNLEYIYIVTHWEEEKWLSNRVYDNTLQHVKYTVNLHMPSPLLSSHLYQTDTSIKQSPVLKGHIFLALSKKISYEFNLF